MILKIRNTTPNPQQHDEQHRSKNGATPNEVSHRGLERPEPELGRCGLIELLDPRESASCLPVMRIDGEHVFPLARCVTIAAELRENLRAQQRD